jgi:hypothetical protein
MSLEHGYEELLDETSTMESVAFDPIYTEPIEPQKKDHLCTKDNYDDC